jgi:O-antigen/teichoic acid export membrane protein
MAIIHNLKATTIHKAFILSAFTTTFVVVISFLAKDLMDKNYKKITAKNYAVISVSTLVACLISYYFMNLVFGYGGGMIDRT